MKFNEHKEFIRKSYSKYRGIGYIECPAFDNEKIYFNKIGFNHLIWKGKKMRDPKEQRSRINLINHAIEIIEKCKIWTEYREDLKILGNGSVSNAKFWSLSGKIKNTKVKAIIRQTNDSRKYFLSVM